MRVKVTEIREYMMDVTPKRHLLPISDDALFAELLRQKDQENAGLFHSGFQGGAGELWKGGECKNGNKLAVTTVVPASDKFVRREIEKAS
jgi:hypothetical protein